MDTLYVFVEPRLEQVALGYAAANDVEDEVEHVVVVRSDAPPGRFFITSKTYEEMETSLKEIG